MTAVDKSKMREAFRCFSRNFRWGTCGDCPHDGDREVYPELCNNSQRYDHTLTLAQLVEQFEIRQKG